MLWFRGRQRKKEDELERELRNHVYLETEEQRERGVPAEEARYAALRAFGNVTRVKEIVREMWGPAALAGLGQDIRYSLRSLRNNASFTTVAILTLALGIGATTTIFTVVNAVLLRPLPFSEPDQLVQLWETEPSPGNFPLIGQDYLEWQANSRSFAQTSIYSFARFYSASGGSEAQPVTAINTEANFFSLLRAQPLLGRTFAAGEDQEGKNHVAVISYRFWQSFFGGQEDVVNKTVELNREPYTVVGVMPEWFNFPASTSLYVPIDMGEIKKSSGHTYRAIGRLRPESTVEQAQAELSTIAKGIAERDPDSHYKIGAVVVPEKEYLTSYFREQCLILFGAVGLVLLVACANVANLLLARATGRRREVAVRSVLGAQRWRIVRQLLTESVLLSVAGAALGTIA
ncbi:MAG TPA: ABC transporter permease, partial [Alphaproteobacteria bacterium]|nr:ABC transporter permease [Alphaproteobacteria bacterium]